MQLSFVCFLLLFFPFTVGSTIRAANDTKNATKISIPMEFPEVTDETSKLQIPDAQGIKQNLTINPQIQSHLTQFIKERGSPIAAVVVMDAKSGKILAMTQGRKPSVWGGTTHSALHNLYPAASVFKTVVAGAAFDLSDIDPAVTYGLEGGCADVRPTGVWLNDLITHKNQMSLFKAYGNSCNGFFAKIGVNHLGLKTLVDYANRFGWDGRIETDFNFDKSPLNAPSLRSSSVHAVGRFAAGFGAVGLSPIHAAWLMTAIANNGIKKPMYILENSIKPSATPDGFSLSAVNPDQILVSASASQRLRNLMEATVKNGTASFAFKRGKYRPLREFAGGKTGTLTGHTPYGVTTWFAGMMPLDNPQVVVAAVVVLEDLWHIKGPNLAAEAFWAYDEFVAKPAHVAADIPVIVPTSDIK